MLGQGPAGSAPPDPGDPLWSPPQTLGCFYSYCCFCPLYIPACTRTPSPSSIKGSLPKTGRLSLPPVLGAGPARDLHPLGARGSPAPPARLASLPPSGCEQRVRHAPSSPLLCRGAEPAGPVLPRAGGVQSTHSEGWGLGREGTLGGQVLWGRKGLFIPRRPIPLCPKLCPFPTRGWARSCRRSAGETGWVPYSLRYQGARAGIPQAVGSVSGRSDPAWGGGRAEPFLGRIRGAFRDRRALGVGAGPCIGIWGRETDQCHPLKLTSISPGWGNFPPCSPEGPGQWRAHCCISAPGGGGGRRRLGVHPLPCCDPVPQNNPL
ncbi:microtubule-associated proteins 1A/1B light chain 3C-like [Platysternon megacephalum]|uniref:Microtubule-associated proteins 1A/1B light chain 3C-like n=1 Tax=Platysternon megacephalum TaxID=55544 RepID=A0A4D9DR83_9SAUR|nr:microtubule-associated proteins 1A/1B light chain 3C-like [Platysternon megacephalum]